MLKINKKQSELPIEKPKLNVLCDELLGMKNELDRMKNAMEDQQKEIIAEMRRIKQNTFRSNGYIFTVSFTVSKEKIKIVADNTH